MEEKTIQRIKKLQALAERGVGGEKETAAKMLQRLLEKNGISTLEELEEDEAEYFLFSYKGRHEIKLLKQCMYKVLGYSDHTKYYRTRGTRQKIGIYCTKAQRIEIELEFEFYRNIQKSIKIDTETLEVIEGVEGRSFSDKVRNMVAEYRRLKYDGLASKK